MVHEDPVAWLVAVYFLVAAVLSGMVALLILMLNMGYGAGFVALIECLVLEGVDSCWVLTLIAVG